MWGKFGRVTFIFLGIELFFFPSNFFVVFLFHCIYFFISYSSVWISQKYWLFVSWYLNFNSSLSQHLSGFMIVYVAADLILILLWRFCCQCILCYMRLVYIFSVTNVPTSCAAGWSFAASEYAKCSYSCTFLLRYFLVSYARSSDSLFMFQRTFLFLRAIFPVKFVFASWFRGYATGALNSWLSDYATGP